MHSLARSQQTQRGSLLIVAMLLCAIIGIALASYLQLTRTALTLSNRSLYNNASMNFAENGLEEAMYSINKMVDDPDYDWEKNGWGIVGADAHQKWTNTGLSQNTIAVYRVYVFNYKGVVKPKLIARSSVTLGGASSPMVEKWIEVDLEKTSKFSNGLVARNSIIFNGTNASVDSWNSDPDTDPSTKAIAYSTDPSVRRDNGSVGSISISNTAVDVRGADIWGYVASGTSVSQTIEDTVSTTGYILGKNSVYDPATWGTNTNVDPNRLSTNFTTNFDPVSAPTATAISLGTIDSSTELPRKNGSGVIIDTPTLAADGKYYYYYSATQVSLKSTDSLKITSGNVILTTGESSGKSVTLGGQSSLSITTGASLQIYAPADIDLTGGGVANGTDNNGNKDISLTEANQPVNLQIYGTKTSGTQTIKIAGNGVFSGVVYAPQGSIIITGNSDTLGSFVGNSITVSGSAAFHYDESLANFGGKNPFRVAKWQELTTSDQRSKYSKELTSF